MKASLINLCRYLFQRFIDNNVGYNLLKFAVPLFVIIFIPAFGVSSAISVACHYNALGYHWALSGAFGWLAIIAWIAPVIVVWYYAGLKAIERVRQAYKAYKVNPNAVEEYLSLPSVKKTKAEDKK